MKAIALAHEGLEDISSLEISGLISTTPQIKPGLIIFDIKNFEELALVCYKAQSIKKAAYLLDNFKLNSIDDLKSSAKKCQSEIKKFLKNNMTFCVKCTKIDNDDFENEDICLETADSLDFSNKVVLKNPDLIIFVYINKDNCYLTIDFSGKELDKRDYRIYTNNESIKATICYSLLRISNYKKEETILDPFCRAGTILIEAALYSKNLSPNFYSKDKLSFRKLIDINPEKFDNILESNGKIIGSNKEKGYIISSEKNAKIAGIKCQKFPKISDHAQKLPVIDQQFLTNIDFFQSSINNIDKKISPKTIDKIITMPPNLTKRKNPREIETLYNDFFQKADVLLKNNGTITLITKTLDLIKNTSEKNNFSVLKERDIIVGDDIYKILVFNRK